MSEKKLVKQVAKIVVLLVLAIAACRLTRGYIGLLFGLAGVYYSLTNKLGLALCFYLLFPFLTIINPMIIGEMPRFSMIVRLSTLLMTVLLLLIALQRRGRHQIPLGGIFLFLSVALVSSMGGWFPMISYLKLINYTIFILGIWIGTRNLHRRPDDVFLVRSMLLAMIFVFVIGTILTLPFPEVAYYVSLRDLFVTRGIEAAVTKLEEGQVMGLLTGMCNHSQSLAPVLACSAAWLVCDMIFLEKRIAKLHAGVLLLIPILLFMTRSRLTLFVFGVVAIMIYFYAIPKIKISARLKGHLLSGMIAGLVLIIAGAIVGEVRNRAITRWLRKSDDLSADERTIGEALTDSRMGTLERSMREFRRNPMLGSGFQVWEAHPILYEMGEISLFSAPIEKGLLPTMVLGETGILGEIAFVIFLVSFWIGCKHRHLLVTLILFVVMFSTNIGEATFFSPSGTGGILWMLCVVGGFVIDTMLRIQRGVHPNA
ncbi:MAG: O-antigen ligase family protein [Kiritimatiellae bacterium]|nr:O-antigen ligase family protein [Kiritimatiellia bacterium]